MSSVQVVDEATSYTKQTDPAFGQTGSGMKPLLYAFLFDHNIWATIEGSLEQMGKTTYGLLALEAQQFMNSVDPTVWNDNTDTMQLLMAITALRTAAGGAWFEGHGGDGGDEPTGAGFADSQIIVGDGEACSFTSATFVTTSTGKQAIGKLHSGEKVLAYNIKTQMMEWQPIVHVWIHNDNDLVDLTLTTIVVGRDKKIHDMNEVVHTNKKHPFFTLEHGFLPVSQITLGMHVLRADGNVGVVIGWHLVPGIRMMYNLEVAQDHTFTVGDGQWIVHNCNIPVDVYRSGNASSPKISRNNLRPGSEYTTGPDGEPQAVPGMGVSTSADYPSRPGNYWNLPSGTELPEGLQVVNDHGSHWQIEPTGPMSLDEYVGLLEQTLPSWNGPIRVR